MNLPSVAIVGRANVGKSSLFNAICRRRVAIVDPMPGVTRDRIVAEVRAGGRDFELVDTGGVGMESAEEIVADVEMQIEIAIAQAELVLLVVDAQVGLHSLDRAIAQRLREAGKSVMVVANKAERQQDAQSAVEFFALGLGEPVAISAAHSEGIQEVVEGIAAVLPEAPKAPARAEPIKLAIVGRRNVGKSTLINYLAQEPRVVVSEIPGTTRDSVDVRLQVGELDLLVIDTAGVRKKRQLSESVEYYSHVRTLHSIHRCDVAVHMLDAPNSVSQVDMRLAGHITSERKACALALNKMDLAPEGRKEEFRRYVRWQLPVLKFAPLLFISAKTGRNVLELLEMVQQLYEQSNVRVKTSDLNEAMERITARNHPPRKGNRPAKILYTTQVGVRPPTIALFVNDSTRITEQYERYLANHLREEFAFRSIPIRFVTRRRRRGPEGRRELP